MNPAVEWLVLDWLCCTLLLFILCGMFQAWYWMYARSDAACSDGLKVAPLWRPRAIFNAADSHAMHGKAVSLAFVVIIYLYVTAVCFAVPYIAYHVNTLAAPSQPSCERISAVLTLPCGTQVSGPAYVYQLDEGEKLELELPVFLRKNDYDAFGMNMAGGETNGDTRFTLPPPG